MKKNILLIAGPVLAFTAVSCSLEENAEPVVDSVVPMEFTADAAVTKTAITDGNAVIWSEDDAISVFDGAGNHKFTAGTAGSTTTKFSGEAESGKETYYALYPYSADASLAGTTIHSVLPANQYSTADGTFDTMLAPAVAKAEENGNLTFVNVAGLVKFTFTGAGDRAVKSISMTADQSLTGSYSVDMSGEEFSAVATASASAGETPAVSGITLTAKEGNLAAGPYYLVALPGTYYNVKISVVLSDGAKLNGSVGTLDIKAGKIKPTTIDLTEVQPTLYDKFMAGEDIVIAGKTYNISQYEDPDNDVKRVTNTNNTIWDESTLVGNGKIIFVDIAQQTEPLKLAAAGDIILVGVDPNNKPLVVRTGSALKSSNTGSSRLVLKNLNIDLQNEASTAVSPAFNAATNFGELTFDNCDITLAEANDFIRSNTSGTSISEINIIDCNIKVPVRTALNILSAGDIPQTIETFNFSNNILHCDDGITYTFRMINSTNGSANVMEVSNIIVNNNTFVNVAHNNSAMVLTKSIGYAEAKNNLIYYSFNISDYSAITQSAFPFFRAFTSYPTTAICNSNIAYQQETDGKDIGFRIWQSATNAPSVEQNIPKAETDPFEGGVLSTFTPAPAYAEYGAQR